MFVWDIDPALIRIGSFQIRYYGIFFALSLVGGFYFFQWQMKRGHREQEAGDFILIGMISVFVGARLGHVFFYSPRHYLADPLTIFYVWRGGLASHGATIGLVVGLVYFARRVKMPALEALDRFAMSAAWGATMVRLGNFVNSEIVGRVTDVSWAVKFPRYKLDRGLPLESVPWRHPSQFYEAAMAAVILLILLAVDRKLGERRPLGLIISLFVALYFSARFGVEFFKEYQTLAPSSALTMGQWLSIPAALVGVFGVGWALRARRPARSRSEPLPVEVDRLG